MDFNETDLETVSLEGNNERTWGTHITIDGIEYATSLFWQPLQEKDDPLAEIRDSAEEILEGADLFCIKEGNASQFGICVSSQGFKPGQTVAAVSLAKSLSDKSSFVAVFKVNEGWWYVCVRNDIILSDGDMLFLNEEDAKNQFMSMMAVPDWGKKIAPAEWKIDDTEEADLVKLLERSKAVKLQKIKGLRGAKLLLVSFISLGMIFWIFATIINSVFFTPVVRPKPIQIKPKMIKKPQQPPEVKPWENIDNPQQKMLGCMQKIEKMLKLKSPGWKIGDLRCSGNTVSTVWSREFGRMSWMNMALDKSGYNFAFRTFSFDGNSVSVGMSLDKIDKISSPPLMGAIEIKNILNDFSQAVNQQLGLSDGSYTSPRKTVYRFVKFSFSSNYDPKTWGNLLTKFSGLYINSINYSPSNNTWYYEGAIYAL